MPATPLVVLGRVVKPHGISGELRIDYYADAPELLDRPLMLRAGKAAPRPVKIRSRSLWKGQLILAIEGCNDRSSAEQLRGQELLIDESFLPEAPDDEPYIRDLLDLEVRLPSGQTVGTLEDIDFPADQELWTIRAPREDGGHEILFPAVPAFVVGIIPGEAVVIDPPEGLLDLYANAQETAQDDGEDEEEDSPHSARRER